MSLHHEDGAGGSAAAAASSPALFPSGLAQLIALVRQADSSDLSFDRFKALWSARCLPLLHADEAPLREAQEEDAVEPASVRTLRGYFRGLTDMLLDAALGSSDAQSGDGSSAGRIAAAATLIPSKHKDQPPKPKLERCVYIIYALYVLWATQPQRPVPSSAPSAPAQRPRKRRRRRGGAAPPLETQVVVELESKEMEGDEVDNHIDEMDCSDGAEAIPEFELNPEQQQQQQQQQQEQQRQWQEEGAAAAAQNDEPPQPPLPQHFYPRVAIRLPQVDWPVLSQLLPLLPGHSSTVPAAHVLSLLLRSEAFEFTLDHPRREARDQLHSKTRLPVHVPQLWVEDVSDEEEDAAIQAQAQSHSVAGAGGGALSRVNQRWGRTFRRDVTALSHMEYSAPQFRLIQKKLRDPAPELLDNLCAQAALREATHGAEPKLSVYMQAQQTLPPHMRPNSLRSLDDDETASSHHGLFPAFPSSSSSFSAAAASPASVAAASSSAMVAPLLPPLDPLDNHESPMGEPLSAPASQRLQPLHQLESPLFLPVMQPLSGFGLAEGDRESEREQPPPVFLPPARTRDAAYALSAAASAATPDFGAAAAPAASAVASTSVVAVAPLAPPPPPPPPPPSSPPLVQLLASFFPSGGDEEAGLEEPPLDAESHALWSEVLALDVDASRPPGHDLPLPSSPLPWRLRADRDGVPEEDDWERDSAEQTHAQAQSQTQTQQQESEQPAAPGQFLSHVQSAVEQYEHENVAQKRMVDKDKVDPQLGGEGARAPATADRHTSVAPSNRLLHHKRSQAELQLQQQQSQQQHGRDLAVAPLLPLSRESLAYSRRMAQHMRSVAAANDPRVAGLQRAQQLLLSDADRSDGPGDEASSGAPMYFADPAEQEGQHDFGDGDGGEGFGESAMEAEARHPTADDFSIAEVTGAFSQNSSSIMRTPQLQPAQAPGQEGNDAALAALGGRSAPATPQLGAMAAPGAVTVPPSPRLAAKQRMQQRMQQKRLASRSGVAAAAASPAAAPKKGRAGAAAAAVTTATATAEDEDAPAPKPKPRAKKRKGAATAAAAVAPAAPDEPMDEAALMEAELAAALEVDEFTAVAQDMAEQARKEQMDREAAEAEEEEGEGDEHKQSRSRSRGGAKKDQVGAAKNKGKAKPKPRGGAGGGGGSESDSSSSGRTPKPSAVTGRPKKSARLPQYVPMTEEQRMRAQRSEAEALQNMLGIDMGNRFSAMAAASPTPTAAAAASSSSATASSSARPTSSVLPTSSFVAASRVDGFAVPLPRPPKAKRKTAAAASAAAAPAPARAPKPSMADVMAAAAAANAASSLSSYPSSSAPAGGGGDLSDGGMSELDLDLSDMELDVADEGDMRREQDRIASQPSELPQAIMVRAQREKDKATRKPRARRANAAAAAGPKKPRAPRKARVGAAAASSASSAAFAASAAPAAAAAPGLSCAELLALLGPPDEAAERELDLMEAQIRALDDTDP